MTTEVEVNDPDGEDTSCVSHAVLSADLVKEMPKLNAQDPVQYQVLERLAQLQEALLIRDPLMATHLAAIHKSMIEHEEIVNLLTDDEIATIVGAQQAHTGISLVAEVTGKKAGNAKAAARASKLSLGDL